MNILTYGHDSCGLGHLRRTMMVGSCLAQSRPESSVLSVVGSNYAYRYFDSHGENHDYLKLPGVRKTGPDCYESRHLALSSDELISLRSETLTTIFASFSPDLVIVDKTPFGLKEELVPGLQLLRQRHPGAKIILSLRDILDDPEVIRREWRRGAYASRIDALYDEIWIWGECEIYDAVAEYDFPGAIRRKTRYLGYLPPRTAKLKPSYLRKDLASALPDERLVLIAAGGGEDAFEFLYATLAGFLKTADAHLKVSVITGPYIPSDCYAQIERLAETGGNRVHLRRFISHFEDSVRASDGVVCMGGYNTLREVAAIGTPALCVPRSYPRLEQSIRARAFESLGYCRTVAPGQSVADAVTEFCDSLRSPGMPRSRHPLYCRGLDSLLAWMDSTFTEVREPAPTIPITPTVAIEA